MKKHLLQLMAPAILIASAFSVSAGTLTYVPIAAPQSDANSGISNANQYTSAVDGGNAAGTDRAINGIALHALVGSGPSAVADNCAVTALTGTLNPAAGSAASIQADGVFRDVLSDMTFNNGATDNSQQEITLNPASLTPGTTYDLRVYICNSAGQDRQVNLAFVGDGQPATETGVFNEDDGRTSPGRFQDPNQVYYINYRFTWDGNTTPGVTVIQKSGQVPFVLYALTNQPVGQAEAAAPPPVGQAEAAAPPPPPPAAEGNQGITTGMVTAESDQVGVTSDTFYSNESLNKNGRWISVKKYGRCWQPSNCPSDWRPYWRGNFRHCDDCGWTWICDASEEEWGWATYHYGRWCRVQGIGCGWAWIPGTEWSGAWVSWRSGRTSECSCVGWAPLPPEATCRVGVGVSTWVDRECDIGPDYYTFVEVRDFGSSSYHTCGCLLERRRYVNIVEQTVNITNISYINVNVNVNVHVNIYNGGPDLNWCNTEIRRYGKTEISAIHINHFDDPGHFKGGKFSHVEGNMLAVFSPKVTHEKNLKFIPKTAITVPDNKIDHGWNEIKDKKIKNDLRTKIADQTKGQPTTATLPTDVADKLAKASPTPTISPAGSPIAGRSPSASPGAGKSPSVSPTAGVTGTRGATASPSQSPSASPSVSPTAGKSPSVSPTAGVTGTRTRGATASPGQSPSVSPTAGRSPSVSPTPSASPTRTFPGKSVTPGPSVSPSASPTRTFPGATTSPSPVKTLATATPGVSPSASPMRTFPGKSVTPTPSVTVAPSLAPGMRAWGTTLHASPTTSPAPSAKPVPTIGKAWTYTPSPSPMRSPAATATPASIHTPTPPLQLTPRPTPLRTPTPPPQLTPRPTPLRTPTPLPQLTPRATPIHTPTPPPQLTPRAAPIHTPTPQPQLTPRPTPRPTPLHTPTPRPQLTPRPTPLRTPPPPLRTPPPVLRTPPPVLRTPPPQRVIPARKPTPTPTPIH